MKGIQGGSLGEFINGLRGDKGMNDKEFQKKFVRLADLSGKSDMELADMLYVSLPTIVRWKDGRNTPCPLAAKAVLAYLKKEI